MVPVVPLLKRLFSDVLSFYPVKEEEAHYLDITQLFQEMGC